MTTNLTQLLRSLQPVLNPGVYVFASVAPHTVWGEIEPIASFRESEGITVIVEEERAQKAGLTVLFRCAWLTLTVHSGLEAVGLTAAVANALTDAGISCNVVAAAFHDHLFVPVVCARHALAVLESLQCNSRLQAGSQIGYEQGSNS